MFLMNEFDAASFLRVSVRKVRQWTREGLLPYVALPNGAPRYIRDELFAYLQSRQQPAQEINA